MRGWVWGAGSELVLGKLLPWVKLKVRFVELMTGVKVCGKSF